MREMPVGTKGSFTMTVKREHLASTVDETLPEVLATGWMVIMMERAAMDAMRPFLESGESSVGVAMNIEHLAATPPGHVVCATAELLKAEGRRLEFKVSARDETDLIGSGTHQRAPINPAKFMQRLAAKIKR
jgi:fluoroacetyl-CoA thioesterase